MPVRSDVNAICVPVGDHVGDHVDGRIVGQPAQSEPSRFIT